MNLSSQTKDQSCVPCIRRWILNHWTAREVPYLAVLSWDSKFFLSLDLNLRNINLRNIILLGSQVSWHLDRKYISLPGSPACQLHISWDFSASIIIWAIPYNKSLLYTDEGTGIDVDVGVYTDILLVVALLIWKTLTDMIPCGGASYLLLGTLSNKLIFQCHFLITLLYLKFSTNATYFKIGGEAEGASICLH